MKSLESPNKVLESPNKKEVCQLNSMELLESHRPDLLDSIESLKSHRPDLLDSMESLESSSLKNDIN